LNNIRVMGRAAQGVRIVKLQEGDSVSDVIRVVDDEWLVIFFFKNKFVWKK